MKDIYASHVADCDLGDRCPSMVSLKKTIEENERLLSGETGNSPLIFGLE